MRESYMKINPVYSIILPLAWTASALAQPAPTQFPGLVNNRHFQQQWWLQQQSGGANNRLQAINQIQAVTTAAPVPSGTWVNIGPKPVLNGQTATSDNVS